MNAAQSTRISFQLFLSDEAPFLLLKRLEESKRRTWSESSSVLVHNTEVGEKKGGPVPFFSNCKRVVPLCTNVKKEEPEKTWMAVRPCNLSSERL
jgi:hypothetical protein